MKLPVKQILKRNKYKIVDREGFEIVSDVERICDAMLIEDALNNYPKAIQLLEAFIKWEEGFKGERFEGDLQHLIKNTKKFLKPIEN